MGMTALVNPSESVGANARIGRAVAMAMTAQHVKGVEIAKILHMSTASLSARLNGHTPFRADELLIIGQRLEVDPGQFLSDAPVFPLSGEVDLSVITGEGCDRPGQGVLPFRPLLTIQR